jgi:hypothetical protein
MDWICSMHTGGEKNCRKYWSETAQMMSLERPWSLFKSNIEMSDLEN